MDKRARVSSLSFGTMAPEKSTNKNNRTGKLLHSTVIQQQDKVEAHHVTISQNTQ